MFASSVPFELVRGNHETRGNMARVFPSFFPKKDGKIYGSYLLGDVMVVMLDSGEDKLESHWAYAGLTDYDAYRTEQAEWLAQVVKSKVYKRAKYRIVISHFPLIVDEESKQKKVFYGWQDACDKFLPILNEAKVDLDGVGTYASLLLSRSGRRRKPFPHFGTRKRICRTFGYRRRNDSDKGDRHQRKYIT